MALAVAVDAMGGDHAPGAVVEGAILAARDHAIPIVLVGDEPQLTPFLAGLDAATRARITIHHTDDIIGMGDHPVEAIRKHRKASLVEAIRLVKNDPAVGSAVSAGNSGAFMAGGKLILGGIPGISRPGFTVELPVPQGKIVLLDAGAAVDCSAEDIAQFAELGHFYARLMLNLPTPRVALLNVGHEEGKGNLVVKEAYAYLQRSALNFTGNVEGDTVFEGAADVVVCDGFVGNVLLKTAEGVVSRVMHELKSRLTANPIRKLGALLAKDVFLDLKRSYDWEEMAGGILLGVRGDIVVTHGKSGARGIMNAIRLASRASELKLAATIQAELEALRARASSPVPDPSPEMSP